MKSQDKGLTSEQVSSFVNMLGNTRDVELNCSECLQHVSEFAERQVAGLPIEDLIARVENHLTLCPECQEEYLALLKILKESQ